MLGRGRYTVYRGTSAQTAARLLTGRWARWRQTFAWKAKKVAKAVGGRAYLALRRGLLARKYAIGAKSVSDGSAPSLTLPAPTDNGPSLTLPARADKGVGT